MELVLRIPQSQDREFALVGIFAGPSDNGKTELAHWLADLMNKPSDEFFIKVDCGQLNDASRIFGKSGAYQGAQQGSALNNFVLKMSLEPQGVGIVLLDEIEKANQSVIRGLYQVIDKGEWTNKRLTSLGSHTEIIPCQNLAFIMTTNSCDFEILDFAKQHPGIYNGMSDEFDELGSDLSNRIRSILQFRHPFTEAFLGRVGRIIPFLPMAQGDPDVESAMHGEAMTIAKLLIERQQEKLMRSGTAEVTQLVSARTKHDIAKIVVRDAIPEAGVRAIQSAVEQKMGERVMNALLLERGGIEEGSQVLYFTTDEFRAIDFRVEDVHKIKAKTDKNSGMESEDHYFEEEGDLYE